MTEAMQSDRDLIDRYFQLIEELRDGDRAAVDGLMDLWDEDGTFEFTGAPPVQGTFIGAMAIRVLYQNRVNTGHALVTLEGGSGEARQAALGVVRTDVQHVREREGRIVAGWRTTIGTTEGEGFDVAGSHRFVLENGKIKNLRVTVSPHGHESHLQDLRADTLSVTDVGRLSLAAWPVVV